MSLEQELRRLVRDIVVEELERIQESPPVLLTVPAFAERVGVSPKTVYRWITEERITPTRVGGRVLIHIREIDRLEGRP